MSQVPDVSPKNYSRFKRGFRKWDIFLSTIMRSIWPLEVLRTSEVTGRKPKMYPNNQWTRSQIMLSAARFVSLHIFKGWSIILLKKIDFSCVTLNKKDPVVVVICWYSEQWLILTYFTVCFVFPLYNNQCVWVIFGPILQSIIFHKIFDNLIIKWHKILWMRVIMVNLFGAWEIQ